MRASGSDFSTTKGFSPVCCGDLERAHAAFTERFDFEHGARLARGDGDDAQRRLALRQQLMQQRKRARAVAPRQRVGQVEDIALPRDRGELPHRLDGNLAALPGVGGELVHLQRERSQVGAERLDKQPRRLAGERRAVGFSALRQPVFKRGSFGWSKRASRAVAFSRGDEGMRLFQRLWDEDDERGGLRDMGDVLGETGDEGFGVRSLGLALAGLRRRSVLVLVAIFARLALRGAFAFGQVVEDHQPTLAEEGHGVADGAERPRSAVCPSKVSWLCSKPPVARSRASSSAAEKSSGPYSSRNISPLYAACYAARNAPGQAANPKWGEIGGEERQSCSGRCFLRSQPGNPPQRKQIRR